MFSNRSTTQVLIPATSYLRNCIKVYVEACEPSSAASQPSAAVWVCQLGSPDGEEFIGNAFQVKGVLANVDDLKEAIEKKEKLTIAASKINIYHQEDGRWVKDDEDSAVDRGKSKADCYGFTLPAGAAGAT
ncbi:unnamed protein product [Effrenium voratum]|nr:unnamed protein product [Effrenium voratum]